MRQQLLSVLSHAQTTIFSVDRTEKITMLEGAIKWHGRKQHGAEDCESDDDLHGVKYIGKNVDEVFNDLNPQLRQGEIPAFLAPIHLMLDGKQERDMVQEHEIGKLAYQ
jgi:hypothetical protein